jgi:CHRD domain
MRRTTLRIANLTACAAATVGLTASPALAQDATVPEPATFTSMFTAMATPDMVLNADSVPTPGEAGATGTFNYRINSADEIICYDITLRGVTAPFQSPARTATHIHQAAPGKAGPPRIALPNPQDTGDGTLRSQGCMQGPFTTGIMVNGADTGTGFTLDQIEADPAAFFTDTHTSKFTAGAVRGQLSAVPMGGVETGAGGASGSDWAPTALGAMVLAGVAGVGVAARRRRARV